LRKLGWRGALGDVPGNHDIPLFNLFARIVHPYAAYRKAFGQALEQHLQTASLSVTTVNTTRWWRHKNGQVSEAQIDRVCKKLSDANAQQLRVVVVHQPVHVLRPEDEHDRLNGWHAAVDAWSAAGADIVMGGHIHLPYVCELSSQVKGLARRMWCVQAGTAVSSRVRLEAPNSVNVVEFETHTNTHTDTDTDTDTQAGRLRCNVERWDYQKEKSGGRFILVSTTALALQRD
jgi:3',5'-cyclic AMP phosphodiesterase CpdA